MAKKLERADAQTPIKKDEPTRECVDKQTKIKSN